MKKREIDLALVIQNVDLFYFTGTIQRGYLAVSERERPFLRPERLRKSSP